MSAISSWPTCSVGISLVSINGSGIAVPSQPNNPALLPVYTEMVSRCRSIQCKRGKQYELDIPRAQLNKVTFENRNGDFDPLNTAGAYYPGLNTHRQIRFCAAYPVANKNLLDQQNATGGDSYLFLPLLNIEPRTGVPLTTQSATVLSGARAYQSSYPATSAPQGAWFIGHGGLRVGTQYTFSVYCFMSAGSLAFAASADTYDKNSTLIAHTAGTPATITTGWTRLSVTFTPGAGTVATVFFVANTATGPGSTFNLFTDQMQLEVGASATTWISPTFSYPLMTGYIDSFKQYFDAQSYMGLTEVTVTDAFGPLSQTTLLSAVGNEIMLRTPSSYWPLTDSSTATSAGALNAPLSSAPPANPGTLVSVGAGSVVKFGNTSILAGAPNDSCLNFDSTAVSGVSWTELQLGTSTPVISSVSGGSVAVSLWFTTPATNPLAGTILMQETVTHETDFNLVVGITGVVQFNVRNAVGGGGFDQILSSASYADGKKHFLVAQVYSGSTRMRLHLDGVLVSDIARTGTAPAIGLQQSICRLGAQFHGQFPFIGNMSHFAVFNNTASTRVLADSDIVAMNQSGINGFSGEYTDARFGRVAGYSLSNIFPITPPVGAAQLEAGLLDSSGQSVLDALNLVIQDEQSNMFISGEGFIQMEARHDRWRMLTPAWTIGDAPGELPYMPSVDTELDDVKVVNYVTATNIDGITVSRGSQSSIYNHFTRAYPGSLSLKVAYDNDVSFICEGIVWRNKEPMERLSTAEFMPSTNVALWPFALGSQISQRLRYNRRPPGGLSKSLDVWLESIEHNVRFDPGSEGSWIMQIEASPGLPGGTSPGLSGQAFLATAARTTLKTSTIATATSFTLNALADAATNTSQSDGWTPLGITKITIWDGASTETLTVSTIATTTLGYTQFVLTTTTGALFAHASGVTISEALPATALAAWTYNTFDSAAAVDGSNVVTY